MPYYRGIFDDKGRLIVAINHNTDLGDAWEWAEVPEYPLKYSTFAYEMAVIIREGIDRMFGDDPEDVFYYLTLYDENYASAGYTVCP